MSQYILRRLLWLIPVLLTLSFITFALMHLVPGGPWDREKQLPPAVVENLNRKYGLDRPVWLQYLSFVANTLRGDLGISYVHQDRSVTDIILNALPITATLGLLALILTVALGLSLGTAAAFHQNSWLDYICVFYATSFASIPGFVLGILMVIIFSVTLHLLPTGGWGTPEKLIMPVIALASIPAAVLARVTRASTLEVLHQDYIRTAHAKGLSQHIILYRHTLKNALIPVLTLLGPEVAYLVSGSFIIENLFSIPGMGRLFVQGVFARDYGLIMGTVLFYAFVVAVANLVIDVLYGVVDPRIRYD